MSTNEKSHSNEELFHTSQVIAEIVIDGKPARILRIAPNDIFDEDLQAHARNLANVNAAPRGNVRFAAQRQKLREIIFRMRDMPLLQHLGVTKKLDVIYPDFSREEHFHFYSKRGSPDDGDQGNITHFMSQGRMYGIQLEGRIIALLAYDRVGTTQEGRPVLSLTKASTLDGFKGKNLTLPNFVMKSAEQNEDDTPLWITASVNRRLLEVLRKKGWHVVEMNADIEAVQIFYQKDKQYIDENMIPQGYKAAYMDPRSDREMMRSR